MVQEARLLLDYDGAMLSGLRVRKQRVKPKTYWQVPVHEILEWSSQAPKLPKACWQNTVLCLPDWLFSSVEITVPKVLEGRDLQAQLQAECENYFGADAHFTSWEQVADVAIDSDTRTMQLLGLSAEHYAPWEAGLKRLSGQAFISIEPRSYAIQRAANLAAQTVNPLLPNSYVVLIADQQQSVLITWQAGVSKRHLLSGVPQVPQAVAVAESDVVSSDISNAALSGLTQDIHRALQLHSAPAAYSAGYALLAPTMYADFVQTFADSVEQLTWQPLNYASPLATLYDCPALLGLSQRGRE